MMNTPIKTESGSSEGGTVAVTPDGPENNASEVIVEPNDNDVLCGRGGSINSHPGNERFRVLVEKRKRVYLTARFKREKRLIAASIVSEIRSLKPPGRFLAKESKAGSWYDIGDDKARDKTSQALRENAPSIRAEIETEINQQREEMQRAEEEAARAAHGYHQQSWGGYFGSYYGYGHDYGAPLPPPNRGPPPPQGHPPAQYHQGSYNSGTWDEGDSHHHYEQQHPGHPEQSPKSGFEMPNFVGSVPSSFAAWTKSFSFGGHSSSSDPRQQEGERSGRHSTPHSHKRPIPYTHHQYPPPDHGSNMDHPDGQKRIVHFQDDSDHRGNRPHEHYQQGSSPYYGENGGRHEYSRVHDDRYGGFQPVGHKAQGGTPAFSPVTHRKSAPSNDDIMMDTDNKEPEEHISSEIQPHVAEGMDYAEGRQESSLLAQVANHILTSWDTNTICAHGSTDVDDNSLFEKSPSVEQTNTQHATAAGVQLETVESEGQEVELVEMAEESLAVVDEETRMPPPTEKSRVEIDWPTQIGNCHQWIPDSLSASGLFGPKGSFEGPLSPVGSVTMVGSGDIDATSAHEGFSCVGSIGGDSLCHVFKHDALGTEQQKQEAIDSTEAVSLDHKVLSTIPSWEKSFRSKSPSSVESNPSMMSSEKSRGEFA